MEPNDSNLRKAAYSDCRKTLRNSAMLAINTFSKPQMNCKRLSFLVRVAACFLFATTTRPVDLRWSPMR